MQKFHALWVGCRARTSPRGSAGQKYGIRPVFTMNVRKNESSGQVDPRTTDDGSKKMISYRETDK